LKSRGAVNLKLIFLPILYIPLLPEGLFGYCSKYFNLLKCDWYATSVRLLARIFMLTSTFPFLFFTSAPKPALNRA
jgi:hypothetical protein